MRKFKNVKEITDFFIKSGWGEETGFTEFLLEEAEKREFLFIINGIRKGKKYFKMNVSGDIYDDTGQLVMFDMPCLKECESVPFW